MNFTDNSVQSWGRYPKHTPEKVFFPSWTSGFSIPLGKSILPYGKGRSYGDSCQNSGGYLLDCSRWDKLLSFDENSGVLRCEAGVTLDGILREFVPRGWFLPVTPGTRFVTVGGAIANDVNGKNHHCEGTFGRHILRFGLLRSGGDLIECSPVTNTAMFGATIGGMGLTGVMLWAEIQLRRIQSRYISAISRKFRSLDEYFDISPEFDASFPYTMAWTDCTSSQKFGRGILLCGNHAASTDARPTSGSRRTVTFPFDAPAFLLNTASIRVFNSAYYHRQCKRSIGKTMPYEKFFYPLDSILHWNRMYGRRGFLQYQFHLPFSAGKAVIMDIFQRIALSGEGSFLAVLKTFGNIASPGLMSFPRQGVNLALDFPIRGASTFALLNTLDELVAEAGGAVYPAKDARMSAQSFRRFYPHWQEFIPHIDPHFSSDFWRRVCGRSEN